MRPYKIYGFIESLPRKGYTEVLNIVCYEGEVDPKSTYDSRQVIFDIVIENFETCIC